MAPIAIDLDIGSTLQAIDVILSRRYSDRATVWDFLSYDLEAVAFAIAGLDRMYLRILAEVEDVVSEPKPSPERIKDVIAQANMHCTDGRLSPRLAEWRGIIESTAYSRTLKDRRYRELISTLRSINELLESYVLRLYRPQDGGDVSVQELKQPVQVGDTSEPVLHDRKWDLRTVLDLLKSVSFQLPEDEFTNSVASLREACEQAVRNYNKSYSRNLANLIGVAEGELALERL